MSAEFSLDLMDFENNLLETEIEFIDLQYSRTFGSTGSLVASLPLAYYDPEMFGRDSILHLYRTPEGGSTRLEPDAIWFTRKVGVDYSKKTIVLTCVDQMDLLRRRIVGYRAYSVLADKTIDDGSEGAADDLMKEYVRENMGADVVVDGTGAADSDRDLSDYLDIEDDNTLGPTVEHAGAYQSIMDVLNSLKSKSADAGTEVYFDILARPDGTFTFATPLSATGASKDQVLSTFTFNPNDGNLSKLIVERDYTDEITSVYVTSGGTDITKHYIRVSSGREELTPFNRIEAHIGEGEYADAYLTEVANALMEGAKPKVRVSANIIDSPIATYGKDFYYGDRVAVIAGGYTFDCFINSIRNRVGSRGENLSMGLVGEVPLYA